MSETPHRNQRGWRWNGKKRKQSKKYRHRYDNQASPNQDGVQTEGYHAEQGCSRSNRIPNSINPGPSCSNETLPARLNRCSRTTNPSLNRNSLVCSQQRICSDKKSTSPAYRTVGACLTPQFKEGSRNNAGVSSCGSETELSASNSGTSSSSNGKTVKEIPGFYYDPDKKRYFRLVPGHNNFNPLTRESLDKKHAETKRLEMLENNLTNSKPKVGQCKQNLSLCPLQRSLQTGQLTSRQFTRYAQEQAISSLNLRPRKLGNFPDQYFDGESGDISFLQVDRKLRRILMVLSHDSLSRMWQGTITCDGSNPRSMTLSNWKVLNIIGTRNTKITSASWISTDGTDDLQVIYSISGGPMNTVQLMKCPDEEDGRNQITYSYESNHELAWTCAWSNNPLTPGYLSIGSNNKALVVNTVAAEKWKVFSNHSDVLAQVFATTNPLLYNGTRRGEILGCDLRTLTGTRSDITRRLRHKVAVCSIRLLKDENYLVASDMSGQIRLWDLRQCLCVQEYKAHHNTHSYLPICIDSTENILYGVGEDRYTRLWSLKDGHLLRTIPCPRPLTPITPSVVYSQEWRSGARGGLLLGVQRDFYWYSL
ncbi:DDB1- and CUL4-associated factor 4-like [Patiria miniata]|uniref:DDB1- and CUL4-associated factor 4 n=1 Tax=Patiria miniata TaxID=46514 RepID=A0A914BTB6_PATMI|nr:DDB1- and CUL4-associated factor 4-like [Patiria miniata]